MSDSHELPYRFILVSQRLYFSFCAFTHGCEISVYVWGCLCVGVFMYEGVNAEICFCILRRNTNFSLLFIIMCGSVYVWGCLCVGVFTCGCVYV